MSVSRNMWPDILIAAPRVFGKFKRWVHKAGQLVRIVWDDNEGGTHALDHLIEHELSFEDGENGEPALELLTEEPAPRSRPPRSASPSDSGSSSASESDTEAVRPPLATASTKAGTSWRHEPEGIKEDNRRPGMNEKPSFACGNENITSLLEMFLYLLRARAAAAVGRRRSLRRARARARGNPPTHQPLHSRRAAHLCDMSQRLFMLVPGRDRATRRTVWFVVRTVPTTVPRACAIHPRTSRKGTARDCLAKHRNEPAFRIGAVRSVRQRADDALPPTAQRGLGL